MARKHPAENDSRSNSGVQSLLSVWTGCMPAAHGDTCPCSTTMYIYI